MPFDPNVLNYFLIVLGGFGVVWGFRFASGDRKKRMSEFAYAAFSTIWGIPLFMIFVQLIGNRIDLVEKMFTTPMIATPALFILGGVSGYLGGFLFNFVKERINLSK